MNNMMELNLRFFVIHETNNPTSKRNDGSIWVSHFVHFFKWIVQDPKMIRPTANKICSFVDDTPTKTPMSFRLR